jgi:hypothetical protein
MKAATAVLVSPDDLALRVDRKCFRRLRCSRYNRLPSAAAVPSLVLISASQIELLDDRR